MSCQCVAVSTGKPCQNPAKRGSQYCRLHQNCRKPLSLCHCVAVSTGKRCRNRARTGSDFCAVHQSCKQIYKSHKDPREDKKQDAEHPLLHIDPIIRLIASYVPAYKVDLVIVIPTGYKYRAPEQIETTVDFLDEETFKYYSENQFNRLIGLPSFMASLNVTADQRERLSRIIVKGISTKDKADYQVPPLLEGPELKRIDSELSAINRHLTRMCGCRVVVDLDYVDTHTGQVGFRLSRGNGKGVYLSEQHLGDNWSLSVFIDVGHDQSKPFVYEMIRKYIEPELTQIAKIIL